jgi:hypothetical protein
MALLVVFFVMALQMYARPYEADSLDRLQTFVYATQFLFLFIGLLLSSKRGAEELQGELEGVFIAVFVIAGGVCCAAVRRNLLRFRATEQFKQLSDKHELGLNPAEWSCQVLTRWLNHRTPAHELELFKAVREDRALYAFPPHMVERILTLAKQSPELLEFCLTQDYAQVQGTLGEVIAIIVFVLTISTIIVMTIVNMSQPQANDTCYQHQFVYAINVNTCCRHQFMHVSTGANLEHFLGLTLKHELEEAQEIRRKVGISDQDTGAITHIKRALAVVVRVHTLCCAECTCRRLVVWACAQMKSILRGTNSTRSSR